MTGWIFESPWEGWLFNDPAMSEIPPPMPEIPKIPRGPLWICLLAPQLMAAVSTALTFSLGNSLATSSAMNWLPGVLSLLSLAVFILCLIRFILILNRRYSTSTVVLLTFGYVIGQGVISFAMFFGACLLMMRI